MDKPIGIYAKLIKARVMLQSRQINKSGHNKFAGYKYFELADFLPAVQDIFAEVGLVDVIQFTADVATMHLIDTQDGSSVVFTSPMGSAQLKGCHEVQNIGAVETYQRRYLYVAAMAIVEHDALDASEPIKEEPEKPKAKKVEPKAPLPLSGKDPERDWNLTIDPNANWKDSVVLGATKAMDFMEKVSDVENLWKVNRVIFDRLKEEDKATYDDLLAMLGAHKKKFS
jgi:hypothetical protein